MQLLKIYLDTSVISAKFDKRNHERMALTEEFFKSITDYQVYISETTLAEINQTPESEQKQSTKSCIGTLEINRKKLNTYL